MEHSSQLDSVSLEHTLAFGTDLETAKDRMLWSIMIQEKSMALLTKRIRDGIYGFTRFAMCKSRRTLAALA